ncbi:hypothetical protein I4J28_00165 [Corynebacterium belfantii]|uniref:hypothetical protein n=1 Tax=Corynebacterium belfantii TaxID=2014537 RepID=UPI0018CAA24E|nr:hypothetical protein [Corynebacterium belfantii]MBG9297644.1 hypothetical protein [Corynebacterium belfantii]MBG9307745.1 hypothetical protein [Corynebacterium belfantii]
MHAPAFTERVNTPSFEVSSSNVKVKLSPGSTTTRDVASSGIASEAAEANGQEKTRAEKTVATAAKNDLILVLIK